MSKIGSRRSIVLFGNIAAVAVIAFASHCVKVAVTVEKYSHHVQQQQPVSIGNKNTSLVIIIGGLRGGEKAWHSLYERVLDANSADLALLVGGNLIDLNATEADKLSAVDPFRPSTDYAPHHLYPNSSLFERAKYSWVFPEFGADWTYVMEHVMNRSNLTSWRELIHDHLYKFKRSGIFGGVLNESGSGAIIFIIRWLLTQILLGDESILRQYERFVITRADHFYQCEHKFTDLDLRANTIHVPSGQGWGGYTDRYLVVGRDNILDALDILPTLFREPQIYISSRSCWLRKHPKILPCNPEQALWRVWQYKGLRVKKFKRVMFTVATKNDTTRWHFGPGKEVKGVSDLYHKYYDEFTASRKNCLRQ